MYISMSGGFKKNNPTVYVWEHRLPNKTDNQFSFILNRCFFSLTTRKGKKKKNLPIVAPRLLCSSHQVGETFCPCCHRKGWSRSRVTALCRLFGGKKMCSRGSHILAVFRSFISSQTAVDWPHTSNYKNIYT